MARTDWRRPALLPLEDGYKRVRLLVAYDGSLFNGWQCQSNGVGVQDVLNSGLSEIYKCSVSVQGSGRTDSGVHALGQVCHFDVPVCQSAIPDGKVSAALNAILPPGVRVLESSSADGSFHARFTTMAREYRYYAVTSAAMLPSDRGHLAVYGRLPGIALLDSYAALLYGTHDFTTFASARDESPSRFRDIYESSWSLVNDMFGRTVYCYRVVGNAFLYHQVRSMVGTMICMGNDGSTADDFRRVLESRDRTLARTTAPAAGLYLYRISYDSGEYQWFEEDPDGKRQRC